MISWLCDSCVSDGQEQTPAHPSNSPPGLELAGEPWNTLSYSLKVCSLLSLLSTLLLQIDPGPRYSRVQSFTPLANNQIDFTGLLLNCKTVCLSITSTWCWKIKVVMQMQRWIDCWCWCYISEVGHGKWRWCIVSDVEGDRLSLSLSASLFLSPFLHPTLYLPISVLLSLSLFLSLFLKTCLRVDVSVKKPSLSCIASNWWQ